MRLAGDGIADGFPGTFDNAGHFHAGGAGLVINGEVDRFVESGEEFGDGGGEDLPDEAAGITIIYCSRAVQPLPTGRPSLSLPRDITKWQKKLLTTHLTCMCIIGNALISQAAMERRFLDGL